LAYERFLAARGLIGIDPAPRLTPYVLEWLFAEHRRAATSSSRGARDNIRIANAMLGQLVRSGDRGVLTILEAELPAARPGTADLLRAMAVAKPPPDRFVQTLVAQADAPSADIVATAYALMPAQDAPAEIDLWVPAAARALADARRQEAAVHALHAIVGKTALGMQDLGRLAESSAPEAVRVTALVTLGAASDATKERPAAVVAAPKPAALQAFQAVLARERAGPVFDEAARALRYTERNFTLTATMYLRALKRNGDPAAQEKLLDYIAQAHCDAGPLADALRPYAGSSDPRIRRAAIAALDSIKPSWRESGERAAAVSAGVLPQPAVPLAGAGADLVKFYGAPPRRRGRCDRPARQRRKRESSDGHAERQHFPANVNRWRAALRVASGDERKSRIGGRTARGAGGECGMALAEWIDGARLCEGRVSGGGTASVARPECREVARPSHCPGCAQLKSSATASSQQRQAPRVRR
jgi:hypothetical protein